jgi:hypothetical protein
MSFYEFAGEHPFLVAFLALLLADTIVRVASYVRRRQ